MLTGRFSLETTIPGIRRYQQFVPISESLINMRCMSDNNEYDFEVAVYGDNANPKSSAVIKIEISHYIICKYDGLYWIGITC